MMAVLQCRALQATAENSVPVRCNCHTSDSSRQQSSKCVALVVAAAVLAATPAANAVESSLVTVPSQEEAVRSWSPCKPKTSCVSTNSFMSPSQYLPPWSFSPDDQQVAFRNLLRQLEDMKATVLAADAAAGYVSARVPDSGTNYDIVQLRLQPDGVVLFKSQANTNRPDPPFCITPGCISGPANRQRLESLRNALGWAVLETDEDKEWQQIMLH